MAENGEGPAAAALAAPGVTGLGFESGGLAVACSIHDGLSALEGTHDYLHGEKAAFGVISTLMLEEHPRELAEEVVGLFLGVGLPVALEEIGIGDATREDLEKVTEGACVEGQTIHNEPFEVYPRMVVDAMLVTDAFGRQRRAVLEGEARLPPRRGGSYVNRGRIDLTGTLVRERKCSKRSKEEGHGRKQRSIAGRAGHGCGEGYRAGDRAASSGGWAGRRGQRHRSQQRRAR